MESTELRMCLQTIIQQNQEIIRLLTYIAEEPEPSQEDDDEEEDDELPSHPTIDEQQEIIKQTQENEEPKRIKPKEQE